MWHNEIKWFINKGVHLTWTDSYGNIALFVFPFALWGREWLINELISDVFFIRDSPIIRFRRQFLIVFSHTLFHILLKYIVVGFFSFWMFRWTACKLSSKNVLHFVLITGLGTPFYKQSLSLCPSPWNLCFIRFMYSMSCYDCCTVCFVRVAKLIV